MRKLFLIGSFLLCGFGLFAQNSFDRSMSETYVNTVLSQRQLIEISKNFSVDKVGRNADGTFDVRLCVGQREYDAFEALDLPFTVCPPLRANVRMAETYDDLVQSWNRYPTYGAYTAAMDTFQTQFPNLCKIDTILAQTPGGHALLVAHISNDLNNRGPKPSFFYASTIHGDEPVGYYLMLRLIHYLLNNYATSTRVQNLVDNIDIWICPLENPDGTYSSGDNTLNASPVSTRYNANGIDMNRSYPIAGQSVSGYYEAEIQAMMDFCAAHQFTMSANFHGGSEVFNFPWDTWASRQRKHADDDWWRFVGRNFADTCQSIDPYYMRDEENGIVEGGDWYVITGSRQDYLNYFQHCREVTVELSTNKVVSYSQLPSHWEATYRSFLNYMAESLNGISGVVTDSITGQPIQAQVYVENHDRYNSEVYTRLPEGDYHRPIKAGTYQVSYYAPGYRSKTFTLSPTDRQVLVHNVQLVPNDWALRDFDDAALVVCPNPTDGRVSIKNELLKINTVRVYDVCGKLLNTIPVDDLEVSIDLSGYVPGIYMLRVETESGVFVKRVMKN